VRKINEAVYSAEIIFALDFSNLSRINDMAELVRSAKATKVMIDHHLEPEKFAAFEQWDVTSASTAGLVFDLIEQLGETSLIDANIASCLYDGLMTDTGGFRHNNTNPR
jgi:phosphoesterase RecJ-like protein